VREIERASKERARRKAGTVEAKKRTDEERRAYAREYKRKRRADPTFRQAEEDARRRRRGTPTTAPVGSKEARTQGRAVSAARKLAAQPAPPPPQRPRRAPVELRTAFRRAHRNSALRRLYPTMEKLEEAWRKGEFDQRDRAE